MGAFCLLAGRLSSQVEAERAKTRGASASPPATAAGASDGPQVNRMLRYLVSPPFTRLRSGLGSGRTNARHGSRAQITNILFNEAPGWR
jgi:hypothetical protein